ncbi:MAG: tRNA (adenosine(37)-N6)-threonylcarbamoyltransferase complex dimerization subunit type 1 TsaB [Phycisphaerae bacterium]|nr:MAG: tRNA (adenosine(37)-N6)-threonylcarbamoyltransferase complex dimerization subunit type 1 TsaB [Phycisphaerae bacterium]
MSLPRILAIETSGRRGSVALALGEALALESAFATDAEHARDLLPTADALCRKLGSEFIDDACQAPRLDHCYVSIGPGSFTGLRVAVTFARHLALAIGVKIVAVPTLDVIAENARLLTNPPDRLAVVLDAKRKQVYGALYEMRAGRYERRQGPLLTTPSELLAGGSWSVIGEGVNYHREAIDAAGAATLDESLWWPSAAMVHRIGWSLAQAGTFTPAHELVPLYVRRPEAEELWERRHAPQGRQVP